MSKVLKHLPGQHAQQAHGRGGSFDSIKDAHNYGKKNWGKWAKELPDRYVKAISDYQSGAADSMNAYKRTGDPASVYGNDLSVMQAEALSQKLGRAIKTATTKEDLEVYRGVDGDDIGDFKVGEVYKDKGYASTTLVRSHAEENYANPEILGNPVLMVIKVPKGSQAAYLDASGSGKSAGEAEVLLQKNTSLRLLEKTKQNDRNVLVWEVVSQG